ncbi:anthranilate synthase component I [Bacillus sp. FJAT-27225]|uniref:anthranilate synthase component I n=1 Tax=Bacillus sp. FJAT-27225 TaxID=1743144 RepID=UPI00080C21E9|nr:anthranilate synthase component I [Bacillus sp. FJAT-27225]OCA90800.1 anthranilate synthase component I [Bacillus sp. FJAT-27225]
MLKQLKTQTKPLVIELNGDTLTPVSIFQKLSGTKKFLLESSLKHHQAGRFSFIGADPAFELKTSGGVTRLISNDGTETFFEESPFNVIQTLLREPDSSGVPFPFFAGAVGYAGYDIVRFYERIGLELHDEIGMPDAHFMFYEELVVFDHLEQKVFLTGYPLLETTDDMSLSIRLEGRKKELGAKLPEQEPEAFKLGTFRHSLSKHDFIKKVGIVKEHIAEGDIFQAVLSHRLQADFTGNTFSCYRKLRTHNPSPYMYYFEFGEYTVIGSSPESLVKVDGRTAFTNPIAGTRPRGVDPDMEAILEKELKEDAKELAEHRMLVDLGRNDLGRICKFGSVQVNKYLEIEKYRHVMHLVSKLKGVLREEFSSLDALASCLPAGTVSGAPKIRAMEIINNLETKKRGLYSGAIGYVSPNGNMDFALAIRTMIVTAEGRAFIQAGAGIVHDSNPESEYEETMNKMRAFLGGLK